MWCKYRPNKGEIRKVLVCAYPSRSHPCYVRILVKLHDVYFWMPTEDFVNFLNLRRSISVYDLVML